MSVVVTGGTGMLGSAALRQLMERNIPCIGIGKSDVDICHKREVVDCFADLRPRAVIHCAAYTAVDLAEDEWGHCMEVNQQGTAYLAEICGQMDIPLIYISSDYVFDGRKEGCYETVDLPCPLSVYGVSKYAGELAVQRFCSRYYIVRTSWLFGIGGRNFVQTMLNLQKTRDILQVVCDQVGSPTYATDLASLLCDMVVQENYGIYHATNEGYCSWAEFAQEIFKQAGKQVLVDPVTSEKYPTRAIRPRNSKLSKLGLIEAGFSLLPSWKNGLARYLEDSKKGQGVEV